MASLVQVVRYLDEMLRIRDIADYPGAFNGLQVENGGEVRRIAAAVDACEAVIARAAADGADLLLVHHGLFWSGGAPVTGPMYRKLRLALGHGLAVYSAHLPLDLHPEFGNNALLAGALGIESPKPFYEEKGTRIGLMGSFTDSLAELLRRLEIAVGGSIRVRAGGPEHPLRVGVVTGGAGSGIAKAAEEGIDTFITGEGPHWSFLAAEELGVNLMLAGHYATETFGVRALAEHLAAKFGVEQQFIDHPTGL
jgi:dinuclear metal center YbgI/SA1388 family protein